MSNINIHLPKSPLPPSAAFSSANLVCNRQICCARPRQVLLPFDITDFIDSPVSSSTHFCAILSSCFICEFWLRASNNLVLATFSWSVSAWPDAFSAKILESRDALCWVMVIICRSRCPISVTRRSCSDFRVYDILLGIQLTDWKEILLEYRVNPNLFLG